MSLPNEVKATDLMSSPMRAAFVFVRDLGFPILVAWFLLWEIRGILNEINATLIKQGELLSLIVKNLDVLLQAR